MIWIFWYPCYYPYVSRDSESPICGIFLVTTDVRQNYFKPDCITAHCNGGQGDARHERYKGDNDRPFY